MMRFERLFQRLFLVVLLAAVPLLGAHAETLVWKGPTKPITIGLSQEDVSHVEFPEPIINVTIEDKEYVDIMMVEGYANRAMRMRAMLPKMATRMFVTGQSGNTYIVILTTDVPYRSFLTITNGLELDAVKRQIAQKLTPQNLIRSMAMDEDVPGVNRETYVIPNWFRGNGMTFDLAEVWQSAQFTGLVVHVRNEYAQPNEVNLPAVVIPKTEEWGVLRYASMENLRLAPAGQPNDRGVLFLIFVR